MLTKKAKEDYVRQGGVRCPFCGSNDISADKTEADCAFAVVTVDCLHCHKSWHERHDLAAIYELGDDGRPMFHG
jgi:hypothetical protein